MEEDDSFMLFLVKPIIIQITKISFIDSHQINLDKYQYSITFLFRFNIITL